MDIHYAECMYHRDALELGFKGNTISFEHRAFEDRTPDAQRAYRELEVDLLANGMLNPLIVYDGHVIIGMRRFEILRHCTEIFPCLLVVDDVSNWHLEEVRELKALVKRLYGPATEHIG